MRTLLFSRSTWRLRNLLPSAQAPIPGPGVSNALNREAIQQVQLWFQKESSSDKHAVLLVLQSSLSKAAAT